MSDHKTYKTVACDFDGTLCEEAFPEIGEAKPEMIEYIKMRKAQGDKIILWTCRVGARLAEAVAWCEQQGLIFDAVNQNLPETIAKYGVDCRKVSADEYIDDRCLPVDAIQTPIWKEKEKRSAIEPRRIIKRNLTAKWRHDMSFEVYERDEVCIQVCSSVNEDMDCVFFVDRKDKDRALQVLEKAWDDFWDQQCEPYGDFLTSEMQKAGISYEVYFKDSADDRYIHQEEEESPQNMEQNLDKKQHWRKRINRKVLY